MEHAFVRVNLLQVNGNIINLKYFKITKYSVSKHQTLHCLGPRPNELTFCLIFYQFS